MKQVLQNLGSGETLLVDVPCPGGRVGSLLIQTQASLVSIGTEKMLIDFGKAGWVEKARKQPDKVRQVFNKIKTDGLLPTIEAVRSKLDQPIPLGYSNVGVVLDPGGDESGFERGHRVVSNGPHAEVVCVPKNLCVKIPDEVTDAEAAFTVVGAIGLQGIRLLQPTLGEAVVVTGLGLIGLLTVQLLRAHGCRVLGIDFDSTKCALARSFGAETVDLSKGEDPVSIAEGFSRGRGVDAVLITASTQSNEPVHQAALMCRKRGRIVLVGVVGLELSRADFYEKELSFQVSCSYGPGRYDQDFELKGRDYPFGLVRWTEQRNFEAVLDMMETKRIDVRPLISHRYPIEEALKAYENVGTGKALGIILEYGSGTGEGEGSLPANSRESTRIRTGLEQTVRLKPPSSDFPTAELRHLTSGRPTIGLIGAGNFTGLVLLPALGKTGARLKSIASSGGVTGTHFGRKFGFELSTTDTDSIFDDPEINTVIITTRHNSHAKYVAAALKAGKHVYVEKPLCLTREELEGIGKFFPTNLRESARMQEDLSTDSHRLGLGTSSGVGDLPANLRESPRMPFLMVGFNRRFAPQVVRMKGLMDSVREPKTLIMTVNAGAIPAEHWTQNPEVGGGRIVGEGCHFVDLLRFLVGTRIVQVQASKIGSRGAGLVENDKVTMTLGFEDGSMGTIHYFANGHKSFAKERLEIFAAGRVLQLDNFRKLTGYGWPGFSKMNLWNQDKGHRAEMRALVEAIEAGKPSPIPFNELEEVTRVTFDVMDQLM